MSSSEPQPKMSVLARRENCAALERDATHVPETHSLASTARCAVNDGARRRPAAGPRALPGPQQKKTTRSRRSRASRRSSSRASASTSTAVIWMCKCRRPRRLRFALDPLRAPHLPGEGLPARALAPGRAWWLCRFRRVDGDGPVPAHGAGPGLQREERLNNVAHMLYLESPAGSTIAGARRRATRRVSSTGRVQARLQVDRRDAGRRLRAHDRGLPREVPRVQVQ